MISEKDIFLIGNTQKPYGIKGEIILLFRKTEYADVDAEYYFLRIDGIFVPFFVEEVTFTTDVSARVKFEDVNDEKTASRYVNTEVFLPREAVKSVNGQDASDWDFFVGYTVVDQHGKVLGIITEVDHSTMNVLFIVKNEEKELLIPATEDFIVAIDEKKNFLEMYLPEGLLDA
jgi:16S rRNA processing protein RimM